MQDRYDKAGPGTVVKILQTSVLCFSHLTPGGGRMVGSRGRLRKKKEGGGGGGGGLSYAYLAPMKYCLRFKEETSTS